MKYFYIFLILLSLFTFAIESQTLKENREKRKLSVSLGYNFLGGTGSIGMKVVSLDYSVTGNFKLGATVQYVDRIFSFNSVGTPLSCTGSCIEYSRISPLTGKVYASYFPFSGTFYLFAGIGRLPDFRRQTTFYGYTAFSLDNSTNTVYDQSISYTVDTAKNYYANGGFGWRWNLDFGLIFGFDFGYAKEMNKKRDIYFYSDSRGLIERSRIPSLRDIVFYQALTRAYGPDTPYASLNIYAGTAF